MGTLRRCFVCTTCVVVLVALLSEVPSEQTYTLSYRVLNIYLDVACLQIGYGWLDCLMLALFPEDAAALMQQLHADAYPTAAS